MTHLLEIPDEELIERLQQWGQPSFRARQIRRWVVHGRAESFEAMTDLPRALRDRLAQTYSIWSGVVDGRHASDDGTEKLVIRLAGGGLIECVLLRDGPRRTICVSSQVGCAMGCVFCASGLDGVDRNLTRGEIIEQMLRLQLLLPPDERLSHIVMMGMGEPLANLQSVVSALQWAAEGAGLGISPRRITISTVGLPPAIRKLAQLDPRFNLAVSLHAPDDELRSQIVPTNPRTGLAAILSAADEYYRESGRRLTFEYVLLAGINDQPRHAHRLVELLQGRGVLLNVIPYNPVDGLPYRTPGDPAIARFREVIERAGVTLRFRQRKGDQIAAACGQLRRSPRGAPQDESSGSE